MTFGRMMKQMQYALNGKILFVDCGAFYIASGKDAILVNKLINLKLNCFGKGVCKVGFPINALEKYAKLLEETGYSFIIYKLNETTGLLEVVKDYNGKYINQINEKCLNCDKCKNSKCIKEDAVELKQIKILKKIFTKCTKCDIVRTIYKAHFVHVLI